jgi:hypothetical protein
MRVKIVLHSKFWLESDHSGDVDLPEKIILKYILKEVFVIYKTNIYGRIVGYIGEIYHLFRFNNMGISCAAEQPDWDFWVVTSCSSVGEYQRFGGNHNHHLLNLSCKVNGCLTKYCRVQRVMLVC